MREMSVREFRAAFSASLTEGVIVKARGKVIGTWLPGGVVTGDKPVVNIHAEVAPVRALTQTERDAILRKIQTKRDRF